MFSDHQPHGWQLVDLSAFDHCPCDSRQRLLTVLAVTWSMCHDLICPCYHWEVMPLMAGLASTRFPTGLPLTPPLVNPPITRWRFAAVVAILLPLPFQTVDTSHQLRNVREGLSQLLSQFLLLGLPRCFFRQQRCYLLFEFGYPFLCFHSPHFITSFNPSWAVTYEVIIHALQCDPVAQPCADHSEFACDRSSHVTIL
jgi:hypothetical protein